MFKTKAFIKKKLNNVKQSAYRAYLWVCSAFVALMPAIGFAANNPVQTVARGWILPVILWVIVILAACAFVRGVMARNFATLIISLIIALIGIYFAANPEAIITLANGLGSAFGL